MITCNTSESVAKLGKTGLCWTTQATCFILFWWFLFGFLFKWECFSATLSLMLKEFHISYLCVQHNSMTCLIFKKQTA